MLQPTELCLIFHTSLHPSPLSFFTLQFTLVIFHTSLHPCFRVAGSGTTRSQQSVFSVLMQAAHAITDKERAERHTESLPSLPEHTVVNITTRKISCTMMFYLFWRTKSFVFEAKLRLTQLESSMSRHLWMCSGMLLWVFETLLCVLKVHSHHCQAWRDFMSWVWNVVYLWISAISFRWPLIRCKGKNHMLNSSWICILLMQTL